MNDGNQFALTPDTNNADTLPNDLHEYAKWLLADPRTLEVWGLIGARLARVECVINENQSLNWTRRLVCGEGGWFRGSAHKNVRSDPIQIALLPPGYSSHSKSAVECFLRPDLETLASDPPYCYVS